MAGKASRCSLLGCLRGISATEISPEHLPRLKSIGLMLRLKDETVTAERQSKKTTRCKDAARGGAPSRRRASVIDGLGWRNRRRASWRCRQDSGVDALRNQDGREPGIDYHMDAHRYLCGCGSNSESKPGVGWIMLRFVVMCKPPTPGVIVHAGKRSGAHSPKKGGGGAGMRTPGHRPMGPALVTPD